MTNGLSVNLTDNIPSNLYVLSKRLISESELELVCFLHHKKQFDYKKAARATIIDPQQIRIYGEK
jgi:hypothetical protein